MSFLMADLNKMLVLGLIGHPRQIGRTVRTMEPAIGDYTTITDGPQNGAWVAAGMSTIAQPGNQQLPTQSEAFKEWYDDFQVETMSHLSSFHELTRNMSLGLLKDAPQIYAGPEIDGHDHNNHPAQALTYYGEQPISFVEVMEIPNDSAGGYYGNVNTASQDSNKLFDGLYYPSYQRLVLHSGTGYDIRYTETRNIDGFASRRYWLEATDNNDVLTVNPIYDSDTRPVVLEFQLNPDSTTQGAYHGKYEIQNNDFLFFGENTENTASWPVVRYFGIFNQQQTAHQILYKRNSSGLTPRGDVWQTDPNLIYWGALNFQPGTSSLTVEHNKGAVFYKKDFTISWQDEPLYTNGQIKNLTT